MCHLLRQFLDNGVVAHIYVINDCDAGLLEPVIGFADYSDNIIATVC